MTNLRVKVAALIAALLTVAGVGLVSAPAASAHHNAYQAVYVSQYSIDFITFQGPNGTRYNRYANGSLCCLVDGWFYVGSPHDVIVTSRERPLFIQRYSATGWHLIPRLANPGHTTYRLVLNGR